MTDLEQAVSAGGDGAGGDGTKKKRKGRSKAALKASLQRKRERLAAAGETPATAAATPEDAQKPAKKAKLSDEAAPKGKKQKIESLFFGQLPYDMEQQQLQDKLTKVGISEGTYEIRLRTDKATGRFLGHAFVEFQSEKDRLKALKLNGEKMGKLTINVERPRSSTASRAQEGRGGDDGAEAGEESAKQAAKKAKKKPAIPVEELPKPTKQLTERDVEELVEDAVTGAGGALSTEDFDQKIREFLSTLSYQAAERALAACVKKAANQDVKNRQAYFMGIIRMVCKKDQIKEYKKKGQLPSGEE